MNKIFLLTCPGSIGANQAWRPSLVLFIPSISLSGVRMSFFMPSIILTLSGNAAISIKEKPTKIRNIDEILMKIMYIFKRYIKIHMSDKIKRIQIIYKCKLKIKYIHIYI